MSEAGETFRAEVNRFVQDKWKNKSCRRCGNEVWEMLYDNAVIVAETQSMWRPGRPINYHELIGIYCSNCGALEQILKPLFDEWKEKQR